MDAGLAESAVNLEKLEFTLLRLSGSIATRRAVAASVAAVVVAILVLLGLLLALFVALTGLAVAGLPVV